jgi:hypothetical protein
LLGKDLEPNNGTVAVAMQRRGKHASTVGNGVMQPVARQLQQLDYNKRNMGVFYVVLAQEFSGR